MQDKSKVSEDYDEITKSNHLKKLNLNIRFHF